jgi:hypothetical protein
MAPAASRIRVADLRRCPVRWTKLILVIVMAALCFGGSFECHGSNHGDDHDDDDHHQANH